MIALANGIYHRWRRGGFLMQASWVRQLGLILVIVIAIVIVLFTVIAVINVIIIIIIIRFGWFIPSHGSAAPSRTHWRQFSNSQLIKPFILSDDQNR